MDVLNMSTSYSRRQGDYMYDIETYFDAGRFRARVVNMVRLESDEQTVSVRAELQDGGATPDEALSKLETAVEAWMQEQKI